MFVWKIIDKWIFLIFLIVDDMCYFLPIDQQIANESRFWWQVCYSNFILSNPGVDLKLENELYIYLIASKIVREITIYDWFRNCEKMMRNYK